MNKLIDLIGEKFGRLTVVERAENSKNGTAQWQCVCDCGNWVVVKGDNLRNGHTKSCGCYQMEASAKANTTHSGHKTRLYRIWRGIKERCYNENVENYRNYGGKGISMCESWRNSFEEFRDWALENGYSDELSIDRIDVNGDYKPGNCRWATMKEQSNNRTNNVLLTHDGKTQTMVQWADEVGIPYGTIKSRINRYGWTTAEALSIPSGQQRNKPESI